MIFCRLSGLGFVGCNHVYFGIYSGRKFARKRGHKSSMQNLFAVILAAGKGTRMKSKTHKVLHPVCGKPMVQHVIDQLHAIGTSKTIMVVGYLGETVKAKLSSEVLFAQQEQQLGTAHAVMQAKPLLQDLQGTTIVLNGDHPLFTRETLQKLVETHQESGAAATVLTAHMQDATGYGRVVRYEDGSVERIVEHKDATDDELLIQEINTGTFCFDNQKLFAALEKVNNDNAQGEYYLPDALTILREGGERISAQVIQDVNEAMGVNDRLQLAEAEKLMRERILRGHMLNGVTIVHPENTYIEADVIIGEDTVIEPGCFLRGQTVIGESCRIGPGADLKDVSVADSSRISYTVLHESSIEKNVSVGPFVYVRSGTKLAEDVKVGCFVDLKKAELGSGTKVSHLAYVGDAEVGENVNIACGVVTVNYDGIRKHKTTIKADSFVGCNVNLVAPVTLEKGSYVAAGSTITDRVPEDSFAIARQRQVTKEGYAKLLMEKIKDSNK